MKKLSLLLAFLSLSMMAPGCAWYSACAKPENVNTKACVAANGEINCAKTDVMALVPHLLPLVQWLFNGATGPINSQDVVAALEHMGFQFVGCSAAQLDADFTTNPAVAMEKLMRYVPEEQKAKMVASVDPHTAAKAYHETYSVWRAKHTDVKFCFNENNAKVCR